MGPCVIALLCAGSAATADTYRSQVQGSAATASIFDISDDGCVETTGQFVAVSSSALGSYGLAIVTRWDYCTDTGGFYAGGGAINVSANGLQSAAASGTLVLDEYTGHGLPPATLEFDLGFAGTGAVSGDVSHYASGGGGTTVFFNAYRSRAAAISGSLSVDGDAASTSDGALYIEVQGEVSVAP